ncbi:MAG: Bifunctional protein HldE [Candidatus Woesebacteria bacterium GW2011_GWB1_41_10]|uniref:Bifunctional protein HldE n=1 Tax=Candidatus Woesebacteria bacterium GW2011_GWB1_41_10 TaxID=1618577 RepID=A0A0G0XI03_9BACT|nr:MAG: Bifunctional protein HldE [Candidatus Woesebacteria bacterium GW2011_GWB1_41_10]
MGHINLFRVAKKHTDILIVGLDNDKTITKTKGPKRPVNNYKRRSEFLSEFSLVDFIFRIDEIFKHGDNKSFKYFTKLFKLLKPNYIFSSIKCDSLWKEKRNIAESLGVKFIPEKSEVTHSSTIIKILESDLWHPPRT